MLAAFLLLFADWPQLLGPARNGVHPSPAPAVSLKSSKQVWKKPVGAGFSAPVVANGKLILFHRLGDKEIVEALNPANGNPIWKFEYGTTYRDDFGFDEGPRGTPTAADGRVYTFGAEGVLHALDLDSGKMLWRVDTHAKFGVRKGFFGAAASPLVGDAVYVNVGGTNNAGIAAFDKATGKTLWTATNDDAGYSSPVLATLKGKPVVLCFTRAGLVALEPATGKVQFRFPWRSRSNASVNAALPAVSGERVFLSASYGTGAVLLDISGSTPKPVWSSDDALSNHYATSVLKDGYLYGFHGRQEMGQSLRCVEFATGKVRWSEDGLGAGTVAVIGDKLLIVRENGEAVTAPATPAGFRPESRIQLLQGVVRSYPAIADGRIYVRNENTLAAYTH